MNITSLAAQNAFQQAIGRAPTGTELTSFTNAFNAIAAQNPSVTTTSIDTKGNPTSTQYNYAERSAAYQTATEQAAAQNPDYASYQAATTYWGALQQALGSIGDVRSNL